MSIRVFFVSLSYKKTLELTFNDYIHSCFKMKKIDRTQIITDKKELISFLNFNFWKFMF